MWSESVLITKIVRPEIESSSVVPGYHKSNPPHVSCLCLSRTEKLLMLSVLPPSSTRDEMRTFARGEFERNKFVHDLGHIRYLISTGKTQFDSMKRYIEQNAL